MLSFNIENKEINSKEIQKLYKTKRDYIEEKNATAKKVLSKGPEFERRLKLINLNFNPYKYKCKLFFI